MAEIDEYYKTDDLALSLIIAGMREIENHGLADFSLRRVAGICGVSCAAPYRHFKNKGELILAIISYVNSQWELLEEQIIASFEGDVKRILTELCIANIRFWAANPNFRHIMLMDSGELDESQKKEQARVYSKTRALIAEFCRENGIGKIGEESRALLARSTVLGTAHMLGSGELENAPETFDIIRACFENIFSK